MVESTDACKKCGKALIKAVMVNGHSAVFDAQPTPGGTYSIVHDDGLIRAYGGRQQMGHKRHNCGRRHGGR